VRLRPAEHIDGVFTELRQCMRDQRLTEAENVDQIPVADMEPAIDVEEQGIWKPILLTTHDPVGQAFKEGEQP
jgi:hypothetical protein